MTSPARLPTKSRKCDGSHSRREGSCHCWPPPERTTVFCLPSAPVTTAATPVSVVVELIAEAVMGVAVPSVCPRTPKGAVFALVAEKLPSPVFLLKVRPEVLDELSSLLA